MLMYYAPAEDIALAFASKKTTHTVLLVEDEQNLRNVVQYILEDAGFVVFPAGDGIEAIQAMSKESFDLIILDLMMPRMDGETFIRAIESNGMRGNLPILLLTAKEIDESTLTSLHTNGRIPKPFDLQDLLTKVNASLHL